VTAIGGVGLDVVEIGRVRRLLSRQGARALDRLFTPAERQYCDARAEPARHYAARVAAKEAVFKALSGSGDARAIGWREIEVVPDGDGRPEIALHSRAALRARVLGVARVRISLTHTEGVAAAIAVLEVHE
jgi:holo-[acyl-carrier protein] synthase